MKPSVLVLGARGRFGRAACHAFASAGWRVLGQVRPGTQVTVPGVQILALDLHNTAALAQAALGASVVVHALNPPYPQWAKEVPALMEAAIRVAQALDATLMFPGNVYNFGSVMPPLLTEATPQHATTRKGQLRVEVEKRLTTSDVRSVVIRAGDFFGSGSGSWFDIALAKDIRRGRMTYPGPLDVATTWAYLPDLARAFVAVANQRAHAPDAAPRHASYGFAGHLLTGQQWAELMQTKAREHGWLAPDKPLQIRAMPWGLMRVLKPFVALFREVVEMQYLWHTPYAISGESLQQFIGPQTPTPLPQALHAALSDLGKLAGQTKATRSAPALSTTD